MMTTVLTGIAVLMAAAYLGYAIKKNKGVPDSISATAYAVDHPIIFTLGLLSQCILMLPALIERSSTNTQFLAFLAIIGLGMVGMSPNYKEENKLQHYLGAGIAAVGSQLLIALNKPILLSTWGLFLPIAALTKFKNSTFWAELVCLINMYLYNII